MASFVNHKRNILLWWIRFGALTSRKVSYKSFECRPAENVSVGASFQTTHDLSTYLPLIRAPRLYTSWRPFKSWSSTLWRTAALIAAVLHRIQRNPLFNGIQYNEFPELYKCHCVPRFIVPSWVKNLRMSRAWASSKPLEYIECGYNCICEEKIYLLFGNVFNHDWKYKWLLN